MSGIIDTTYHYDGKHWYIVYTDHDRRSKFPFPFATVAEAQEVVDKIEAIGHIVAAKLESLLDGVTVEDDDWNRAPIPA